MLVLDIVSFFVTEIHRKIFIFLRQNLRGIEHASSFIKVSDCYDYSFQDWSMNKIDVKTVRSPSNPVLIRKSRREEPQRR